MKSIKEKSIEIYPALEGDLSSTSENLVRRDGFKTGANYVLEQIAKELPIDDKCLNDYGKALVWRLKNCIEQLKNE